MYIEQRDQVRCEKARRRAACRQFACECSMCEVFEHEDCDYPGRSRCLDCEGCVCDSCIACMKLDDVNKETLCCKECWELIHSL